MHPGLAASYADFAERAKLGMGRGTAMQTIERFLRANLSDRFTIADIREILPTTSDVHIGRLLRQLKDRGIIEPRGGGRGAYWMRLPAGSNSELPDSRRAGPRQAPRSA